MPLSYNATNWYWFVAGDMSRVWSSKRDSYFPVTDAEYQAWLARGGVSTKIASELDLATVLHSVGMTGPVVFSSDVNAERDRRISAGFMFNGHLFQSDVASQKRINGAVTLAILAISSGVKPGNLRWHGGAEDFAWLAADNTLVPMDAPTVCEFGKAAGEWEASHVFAARALKDMNPIPRDFVDSKYWPAQ
jgi:hypothetical protein